MRRFRTIPSLTILSLIAATALWAGSEIMSVQVRDGQVRAAPSFLGAVLGNLSYGDRVQVYREDGAWKNVGTLDKKLAGWIHSSALTKKEIILNAGEKDTELAASNKELALAGKGFNSDVEAEFKATHKDINFMWVDKMGEINIPSGEMQAFLKEGGVRPPQGGVQ
jgi:hypothetical protein